MSKSKQKNDSLPIHVYRPTGCVHYVWISLMIFMVLLYLFMVLAAFTLWFMNIFVVAFAPIIWLLVRDSLFQSLAVYENGLEYRLGTIRIFSHWRDLSFFTTHYINNSSEFRISTSKAHIRQKGIWIDRFLNTRASDVLPLIVNVPRHKYNGMIDTGRFAKTDFGSELLYYAPHLFEKEAESQKNQKHKKLNSFTPHWGYKILFLALPILIFLSYLLIISPLIPDTGMIYNFVTNIIVGVTSFLCAYGFSRFVFHLNIYDDGIEYNGFFRIFTKWENVSHFGVKGKNQQPGFWLHEPAQVELGDLKNISRWKVNFLSLGQYVILPRKNIFSREIDTDKLLQTEFGQAVYQAAPHLFGEEKAKNKLKNEDNEMHLTKEIHNETQKN